MAISSFAELKSAIANYYARTDFGTPDDDFITLTEAKMNYGFDDAQFPIEPLRTRQMQERSTAATSGEYLALPTDFLEIINLKVNTASDRNLKFIPSGEFDRILDTSVTGVPKFYTIIGEELRFSPFDTGSTLEQIYYEKIPALSDTNTTNWLLADRPDVYLLGGLFEAALWIQEDNDIAKYGRMFQAAINGMNMADRRSQYGRDLAVRGNIPSSSRTVMV